MDATTRPAAGAAQTAGTAQAHPPGTASAHGAAPPPPDARAAGAANDVLASNRAMRDAVLADVRRALGRTSSGGPAGNGDARRAAQEYVDAHAQGPRLALPADVVDRFRARATDMSSTVERIASTADIPAATARYIDALDLSPALAAQKSRSGVCWPAFGGLDWAGAGLDVEARPTSGHDRLGITGCFCAVAETGTLVFTSAAATPTATMLLPDTHVCVLDASRIVPGMEEAFALVRREHGGMPRAINFVSGPSRTGDIEQTIVLGAHGPFRVHILLLG